jgi:outer membrane protein
MTRHFARAALALALFAGASSAATVEVQPGDTLWRIATRELGNGQRWTEIAAMNGLEPPYEIKVGTRLELPGAAVSSGVSVPEGMTRRETSGRSSMNSQDPGAERGRSSAARPEGPREWQGRRIGGESRRPTARASAVVEPVDDGSAADEPAPPPPAPPGLAAYLKALAPDAASTPLTLSAAVAMAENNLALRAGRLAPRTAATSVAVARASFDPVFTASGDQSWDRTRSATLRATDARRTSYSAGVGQTLSTGTAYDVTLSGARDHTIPSSSLVNPSHASDVTVTVTQPLLEGAGRGAAYADVDASRERLAAAENRAARLSTEVASEIAIAYWTLAGAQYAEQLSRASLALSEGLLVRNERLLGLELIAAVEVLTARAGVASRRGALVAAVNDRQRAAEELLFLIHGENARRETMRPWAVTEPEIVAEPGPESVLEAKALARREDLAAAMRDLDAAGISLRSASNALLPNLDVTGSVGTGSSASRTFGRAWDGTLDNNEPSWSVGLAVTIPIGNRGDRARFDAARIEDERKRLAVVELENSVRLAVRNARRDVVLGRERLNVAEESRKLSEERLRAEQNRLELGLGDTLRVLEAEEDATSAYLTEIRARHDLATAAAQLRAALGESPIPLTVSAP